jgi:hypothetical protein
LGFSVLGISGSNHRIQGWGRLVAALSEKKNND